LKPIVTIGVCVKNGASTIFETIKSINFQDYPHELMEVIFVDDGSKDNTLSIINIYAHKMNIITKIFSQEWKGLGPARNIVINNAEGKYILWVDSDMIIYRDYVTKLVYFMDINTNVAISKGEIYITPDLNWISELEIYTRNRMNVDFNTDLTKSMGTGGSIYRVEAIKKLGGFNENLKGYGEDWDAEFRLRNAGWKFYIIKSCVFSDYERFGLTWNIIWYKYVKQGIDSYKLSCINKEIIKFYRWIPPSALLGGFFYSLTIYKIKRRKIAFLLPILSFFKSFALCYGLIKGYLNKNIFN